MTEETVVRSSCLACGTVDLRADDVTVYLLAGEEPTYAFRCPRCRTPVRKSTTLEAVALLAGAGAQLVEVPREVAEHVAGRPLTSDDLLDLAQALAGTDELARHAGPVTPPGSPAAR